MAKGIVNARFVTSVAPGGDYLRLDVPQIAMLGKSNVGKSSFINAITNRNKLAKTSQSPGKTRLINYFACNNDNFYLVDLPGYGYAKASKTSIAAWGDLIEGYLRSGEVTHLFLLLDSRHPPGEGDRMMYSWIQYYNLPYTLVGTKIDKFAKSKRPAALKAVQTSLGSISPLIGVSSSEKLGLDAVAEQIDNIVSDYYNIHTPTMTSEE